jgi:hypothetical protein
LLKVLIQKQKYVVFTNGPTSCETKLVTLATCLPWKETAKFKDQINLRKRKTFKLLRCVINRGSDAQLFKSSWVLPFQAGVSPGLELIC